MPSVTLSPTSAKPGDTITVTCAGYSKGESRTVAIVCAGVELTRFTTKSATAKTTIKAPAALPAIIEANGMVGCAQVTLAVAGPVTPPASGIPAMPAVVPGEMLRKNFADGKLDPFYLTAYPEDPPHVQPGQLPGQMQPGQYMTQWTRYRQALTDKALCSVHDGVLDLAVRRRPDGSGFWDGSFVTTGKPNPTFTYQYGKVLFAFQLPGATGPADWRTFWQLIGTSWQAPEIDWPEVIGGKMTANLHGPDIKTGVSAPLDTKWHVGRVDKYPTYIEFWLDGVSLKKITTAMTAEMALLADAKVGLATPTTATPDLLRMLVAWIVVAP